MTTAARSVSYIWVRIISAILQSGTSGPLISSASTSPDWSERHAALSICAVKAKGNGARKAAKPGGERGPTKIHLGLDMLRRKKGVTVAEMGEAFGWLLHTTRAWISATAGKKLGNAIETEVVEGRGRVYRIAG